MIADEQARRIALFFLFTLMDERVALQAAHKTVAHLKAVAPPAQNAMGAAPEPGTPRDVSAFLEDGALVGVLRKFYEQHRKLLPKHKPVTMPASAWQLPEKTDIASWMKFQKGTADNEVVAVVLSKVLGFSDEAIAEGLNISIGTARYRVGKGIKHLGAIIKAGA
jgi:hypothetical protein